MKKLFPILTILCALPITAIADDVRPNPMFADGTQNSLSLYIGQGTGSGTLFKLVQPGLWEFSSQTVFMAQYSQPMKIFRLPSRMNLNVVSNQGYRSNDGLSFFAMGISWDVALLNWRGFYLGVGIGPYMRDKRDDCVESRLVFGEKFFIGKNITDRWRMELFTLHFSNGNFTDKNDGFNYAGLAVNYSF